MESDGGLRHLAFFEELGKMDESDPSWRAVSAGLVTMRLVDQWIADGPVASRVDSWGVSAVREAIAQMPDTTPIRRILSTVVDVMTSSTAVDMHALTPRLMAYAEALDYEARWGLAADVYQTIADSTHPIEDADLSVAANLQLGYCLRTLGDLDASSVAFGAAAQVADAAGDLMGVLRARLGEAKLAMSRGNIPRAESILDTTIQSARVHQFDEVHANALVDRAFIAGSGGRHDQAINLSYRALELSSVQRRRDRILTNIATGFRHLGLAVAARDAYLVLAATAQEQYIRWMAELNLMELAAEQGIELQFDKYRRDLDSADFSPQLRVTYLLHVGRGYHALGSADKGIPYLERAIELAADQELNQLLFEAEAALTEARKAGRRQVVHATRVDPSVQPVVDAIHEMREQAGIA